MTLAAKPRTIDCAATFNALVGWMRDLDAPGLIVGISGTDSILSFLIAAKALELAGKPERMLAVHYAAPAQSKEEIDHILKFMPAHRWEERVAVPWLQAHAPKAQIEINRDIDHKNDYQRWADILHRSINRASARDPDTNDHYWTVGTRNATEVALGSYSNISNAASLMPIVHLWKSEVLQLCHYLDVPPIVMARSRQLACDCGRFDLAASHIEEVDWVLMARNGVLSSDYLHQAIDPAVLPELEAFVDKQTSYAGFKTSIPYKPQPAAVIAGP